MLCPASIIECEGLPDETSVEAAEGTVFHWLCEVCLRTGLDPEDFLGSVREHAGFTFKINEEMARSARNGLFFLRQFEAKRGAEMFTELRVDLSRWLGKNQFGTLDVGLVFPRKRQVIVWDWKYGRGVPVYAQDNAQIACYAAGFWDTVASEFFEHEPDPETIEFRLCIEQPRIPGAGGEWVVTLGDIFRHMKKARRAVTLSKLPEPPYIPGEKQCEWCPARQTCSARAEYLLDVVSQDFEAIDKWDRFDLEPRLPPEVTPERRSYIIRHRKAFEGWLNHLYSSALYDAQQGDPVPGLKLVQNRRPARRYYEAQIHHAEARLRARLGSKAFNRTLLSPAQAEERLGREAYAEELEEFVDQGTPGVSLVPEEDSRPQVKSTIEMFEDGDD